MLTSPRRVAAQLGGLIAIVCLLIGVTSSHGQQPFQSYHIGNSLTIDAQPTLLPFLGEQAGLNLSSGAHVLCNSTMQDILESPRSTCLQPGQFGYFSQALPNNDWDAVTLQPFTGDGETTLQIDINSVNLFKQYAELKGKNDDTEYYIYQSWPRRNDWEIWDDSVTNDPEQPTVHSESYFDILLNELRVQHGNQFKLVPTASVLNEVRSQITAGRIDGITDVDSLYRDSTHLSDVGRFIANSTLFSTITGKPTIGLAVNEAWTDEVSPELAATLQEIVWQVVATHPSTGVTGRPSGDFNADGTTDDADFAMWRTEFGPQPVLTTDPNNDEVVDEHDIAFVEDRLQPLLEESQGDFDGSGVLDEQDYITWRSNYGSTGENLPGDGNGDGVVDALDYTIWRLGLSSATRRLEADINGDGNVDQGDLDLVQAELGLFIKKKADANGDGEIDAADYTRWRSFYQGDSTDAASFSLAIPEPTSGVLILAALLIGFIGFPARNRT